MIRNQFGRQGYAGRLGATYIEPLLEAYDLLVALKQPDFLVAALDVREEGFQGGSSDRYVTYLLQWIIHGTNIVKF